jgi:hypothetical protein
MRPLFTIHAGEYLTGLYIQQRLKLNVWIPAKDTGIDLLVTDPGNRRSVSLQVKYGKDFLTDRPALRNKLRCLSWFTVDRKKLSDSKAKFWVFVLHGFKSNRPDFVIIPTPKLQRYMKRVRTRKGRAQIYLSSLTKRCWETRRLHADDMVLIAEGKYENPALEFTEYLNARGWAALRKELRLRKVHTSVKK